jgi:hypothetical protein
MLGALRLDASLERDEIAQTEEQERNGIRAHMGGERDAILERELQRCKAAWREQQAAEFSDRSLKILTLALDACDMCARTEALAFRSLCDNMSKEREAAELKQRTREDPWWAQRQELRSRESNERSAVLLEEIVAFEATAEDAALRLAWLQQLLTSSVRKQSGMLAAFESWARREQRAEQAEWEALLTEMKTDFALSAGREKLAAEDRRRCRALEEARRAEMVAALGVVATSGALTERRRKSADWKNRRKLVERFASDRHSLCGYETRRREEIMRLAAAEVSAVVRSHNETSNHLLWQARCLLLPRQREVGEELRCLFPILQNPRPPPLPADVKPFPRYDCSLALLDSEERKLKRAIDRPCSPVVAQHTLEFQSARGPAKQPTLPTLSERPDSGYMFFNPRDKLTGSWTRWCAGNYVQSSVARRLAQREELRRVEIDTECTTSWQLLLSVAGNNGLAAPVRVAELFLGHAA